MYSRTRLVQSVNRLVRQSPIGNISHGQLHASLDGIVRVAHVMMILVTGLDIIQNLHGFLDRGRLYQYFLETTFQSPVLLNILTVLVQSRRTDTLYLPASQRGFQHIGCIQTTAGAPGTHDRVNLVDKQDNIPVLRQLRQYRLHSLLELSAVLGTRHDRSDIQRDHPLVKQHAGHFLLDDTQSQSLGDSRFADTRVTDQYRIVLLPAAQYLPFDLPVPPHDRVKRPLFCRLRDVDTEIIQYRSIGFRRYRTTLAIWVIHGCIIIPVFRVIPLVVKLGLHPHLFFQDRLLESVIVNIH